MPASADDDAAARRRPRLRVWHWVCFVLGAVAVFAVAAPYVAVISGFCGVGVLSYRVGLLWRYRRRLRRYRRRH